MPIGLSEAGPRRCDQEARRFLGHPRGTSVFPAPIRPMLPAPDYGEACAIGRASDGRALSRQAWNLLPRIRQLDDLLQRRIPWRQRIGEAHPEVIFQLWAGQPLEEGKRQLGGRRQRRELIEARWPGVVADATAQLPRGGWAADDLLDALACLRAAERRATGIALELGGDPDGTGLAMAITC
jgi:predicted RNase H-like nuclease